MEWEDDRLKWKRSDYANIEEINVISSKVHIPLYIKSIELSDRHTDQHNVRVSFKSST